MQLSGRHLLITGGSRGIGAATALAYAREGADVTLLGRTQSQLDDVAGQVRELGRKATVHICDVAELEQVRSTLEKIDTPVDVLVNNAGVAPSAPVEKTDDDTWDWVLRINVHAPYYLTRAVLPQMLERKSGRVITIASVAGKTGFRYTAAYCASKSAVIGMTRALAKEVAAAVGDAVTVNAVCPGWVDTAMASAAVDNIASKTKLDEAQARAYLAGLSPQNRMMTAEEIAELALYLALPSSRGINGQAINVDGGDMPV